MVGRICVFLTLLALFGAFDAGRASGQIAQVAFANGPASDDETQPSTGFSVHKEPQAIVDALSEFDRYCGKEAWEKAFASLATAAEATPTGLIPAKDGFYLPTRLRVRQALGSLTPAGRAAYRLFNDTKAKQAMDNLGPAITPAQISQLRTIADQYFISSMGDEANDRLGDALFESGEFSAAAARWEGILSDFPDSSIPPLRLMTKQAIALARAGDTPGYDSVLATIRERYAGQQVHLGGQDVIATDYLETLAPAPATAPTEAVATPFQLPTQPTPLWQFPLMDDATEQQIQQQLNNMGWGAMAQGFTRDIAPVDFDSKRIYCNWMSACFALDMRTGKMLWRSDKLTDQSARIQQQLQQGQDLSGDSTTAAGDRVLFVRRDPSNNNFNSPHELICLAVDTGKQLWTTTNSGIFSIASNNWDYSGTPLVIGQTAYIVAHAQQQLDASLLAISIKDGSQQWSLALGTNTSTPNWRGMVTSPAATLAAYGSKLYVLTNNGALLAVDLPSHALDWAFTYATGAPAYDPRFGFNPMMMNQAHSPGAMQIIGSMLLLKETDNPAIYAIDLTKPSLLWRRPVDASEMIAHADSQGIMLLGDDLSFMDMASRELQWSAHLPGLRSSIQPVLSPGHIDLFLPRGIFDMDTSSGDTLTIFRGYDHDSGGGTLWRSGDRLVAVSRKSITAYPVR